MTIAADLDALLSRDLTTQRAAERAEFDRALVLLPGKREQERGPQRFLDVFQLGPVAIRARQTRGYSVAKEISRP